LPNHDPTVPNRLGTEPIPGLLLKFAVPSIIAMLVNALYNIVDQIFIGNGIGLLGNAATNVAYPLTTITMAIALLLAQGGASMQNLKLGAGQRDQAEKAVGNMLTMLLACSVILLTVTLTFLPQLLVLFGATPEVLPYARTYTGISIFGLPFVLLSTGINSTIRADGSPTYAMVSMLTGAVVNTILDPLFIFVFDWGIAGAAWATIIGQMLSCLLSVLYLPRYKHITLHRSCFKLDFALSRKLCSLGIASFCNQLAITVVQITLNNSMTHYGALSAYGSDIPLACAGIMTKVNMIFLAIVIGIAQGSQPLVSFNYGAKQYQRVRQAYLTAAKAATCIAVAAFAIFQFCPGAIIALFGEGSAEYFRFSERCFRIYLFCTFLNGIQPVTTIFFTSIGKAIKGTFIALTRQLLFLVPLILILPHFFGIDGIMFAGPIADFVAFAMAVLLMRREFSAMTQLEGQQAQ